MNFNNNKFICPNCDSNKIKSRIRLGNIPINGPYSIVKEEIQCGNCFMDIPSHLGERSLNDKFEIIKNEWEKIYKPEHLKTAPTCSRCKLFYWEIEKKLNINGINSGDIFYQTYGIKGLKGNLVCKICDPQAFKK